MTDYEFEELKISEQAKRYEDKNNYTESTLKKLCKINEEVYENISDREIYIKVRAIRRALTLRNCNAI